MKSLMALRKGGAAEIDAALVRQLLDPAFADTYGRLEVTMELIDRYGSPAILPQVKAFYEEHGGPWAPRLIAYLVRNDEPYGVRIVTQILAERDEKRGHFWPWLLSTVGATAWSPGLQKLAIASLDDPEPEVICSATDALRRRGSVAARDGLIAALDHPWAPNKTYNRTSFPGDPRDSRQTVIVAALLEAHNWALSNAEIKTIQCKCTATEALKKCEQALNSPATPVTVQTLDTGEVCLWVGYDVYESLAEVERKMSLYPAGAHFKLVHFSNPSPVNDPVQREFIAWAKAKNIHVE